MRKIVSPVSGIRSPFGPPKTGGISGAAYNLIFSEPNGFALDFLDNSYAIQRNEGAVSLLFSDASGFALDFTDNTSAVRN